MRPLASLLGCLAATLAAQAPPTASLSASAPRDIAWAAAMLTTTPADRAGLQRQLIAALATLRKGDQPEHRRAEAYLLDAAFRLRLMLPMASLPREPEAAYRPLWLAMQVRAATKDGSDLLARFQSLDEATDLGWELLGDALAERGQRTFALELRTRTAPQLRVIAHAPGVELPPQVQIQIMVREPAPPDPEPDTEWPPPVRYQWQRNGNDTLVAAALNHEGLALRPLEPDATTRHHARLRWLMELATLPAAWPDRFEVRYTRQSLDRFPAFVERAEAAAREALAELDERLRADYRLPANLPFPPLEVVWEDRRPAAWQDREALPKRQ